MSWFWGEIEGNVYAAPVLAVTGAVLGFVFRRRILTWWHKHFSARAELADIRAIAASAHQIAADLYLHHTHRRHELAPPDDDMRERG